MDKKIIFQKCSFNYIYFILYFVVLFINIVLDYINIYNSSEEEIKVMPYYFASSKLLFTYVSILSNFLAIIPFLIKKKFTKKHEVKTNDSSDLEIDSNKDKESTSLIYNSSNEVEKNKKNRKNKVYIFLVSFFELLSKCTAIIYYIIFTQDQMYINLFSCIIPYESILLFILSYFIIKVHFYKLHYFSIILNVIVFVIILIFDLINVFYKEVFSIKSYITYFICFTFDCLEYSFGKNVLLYGFISPYNLLIMKGIFNTFLIFLFSIIVLIVEKEILSEMGYFFQSTVSIILIFAKIIVCFFKELFMWIILDRFSTCYFPLALIIEEILYVIINMIFGSTGQTDWDLPYRTVLYIFSIFAVLVHNEIIIINICGLGSYTKYFLDLKVINEEIYSMADDPDIIKRYDSFTEMDEKYDDTNVKDQNEINNENKDKI